MTQAGEVGHQIPLGHFGQFDRLVAPMPVRNEFFGFPFGHAGRPELPALATWLGELEQRRLRVSPHERRAGGAAAR